MTTNRPAPVGRTVFSFLVPVHVAVEHGLVADVVVIDPAALSSYDTDRNRQLVYRDVIDEKQLVNRSDGVVDAVFIAGTQVWARDHVLPALGTQKLGRPLTFSGRTA